MYVKHTRGYQVNAGKIVTVKGLDGVVHTRLAGGLATRVHSGSCEVALRVGRRNRVLKAPPGSLIIFGKDSDYVLLSQQPVAPPSETPTYGPAGARDALLVESAHILDLIERSSLVEARDNIDGLSLKFPENESARLLQELFKSRVPQVDPPTATVPERVDPDAAQYALLEGLAHLEENRLPQALEAFERAHELDSRNREATERLVDLLKRLGLELYSQGDIQVAKSYWRRVLTIQPEDAETLRFLHRAESVEKKL